MSASPTPSSSSPPPDTRNLPQRKRPCPSPPHRATTPQGNAREAKHTETFPKVAMQGVKITIRVDTQHASYCETLKDGVLTPSEEGLLKLVVPTQTTPEELAAMADLTNNIARVRYFVACRGRIGRCTLEELGVTDGDVVFIVRRHNVGYVACTLCALEGVVCLNGPRFDSGVAPTANGAIEDVSTGAEEDDEAREVCFANANGAAAGVVATTTTTRCDSCQRILCEHHASRHGHGPLLTVYQEPDCSVTSVTRLPSDHEETSELLTCERMEMHYDRLFAPTNGKHHIQRHRAMQTEHLKGLSETKPLAWYDSIHEMENAARSAKKYRNQCLASCMIIDKLVPSLVEDIFKDRDTTLPQSAIDPTLHGDNGNVTLAELLVCEAGLWNHPHFKDYFTETGERKVDVVLVSCWSMLASCDLAVFAIGDPSAWLMAPAVENHWSQRYQGACDLLATTFSVVAVGEFHCRMCCVLNDYFHIGGARAEAVCTPIFCRALAFIEVDEDFFVPASFA